MNDGIGTLYTALDVGNRDWAATDHPQARVLQCDAARVTRQSDDLMALCERLPDDKPTREACGTENGYSGHGRYHLSTDGRRSSSKVHASRGWLCNHQ